MTSEHSEIISERLEVISEHSEVSSEASFAVSGRLGPPPSPSGAGYGRSVRISEASVPSFERSIGTAARQNGTLEGSELICEPSEIISAGLDINSERSEIVFGLFETILEDSEIAQEGSESGHELSEANSEPSELDLGHVEAILEDSGIVPERSNPVTLPSGIAATRSHFRWKRVGKARGSPASAREAR